MKVCVLYSGGKDSNLALLKAYEEFEVVCLITLSPKSEESTLFHYPNTEIVKLQAESLGIPLIMKTCSDDEESSLKALYNVLTKAKETYDVNGVVTGAIRSTYQATRFQRICDDLELWCFNPLWLRDEISILNEALENGFEIVFVRVAGLEKTLLGKKLTANIIQKFTEMRNYLNPAGEGGEYETLVLDGPILKKKIVLENVEVEWKRDHGMLIVKKARLG